MLTLSLPVHQNAHVNKLSISCEKGYSSRRFLYFQSSTVNIFKYKGKYLSRQIPYASHGSFKPIVISNKQAHIITEYTGSYQRNWCHRDYRTASNGDKRPKTTVHDYCLTHPETFSSAVDCFLELNYARFYKTYWTKLVFWSLPWGMSLVTKFICLRNWYDSHSRTSVGALLYIVTHLLLCLIMLSLVTYLLCSDIFTLNTVGVMTQELKSLFHIQQTYQSICTSCDNTI